MNSFRYSALVISAILCSSVSGLRCPDCLDMVVVADASATITMAQWDTQIRPIIANLAESPEWTIGPTGFQFGVVVFGKFETVKINLGGPENIDSPTLVNAINAIPYRGNGESQNVRAGMDLALTDVLNGPGNRLGCQDVCVIISGELTNRITSGFQDEIDNFQQACDRVITIKIDTNNTNNLLGQIASDPSYALTPATLEQIGLIICPSPECFDFVLVLDESVSIGSANWIFMQEFAAGFSASTRWDIGMSPTQSRVAVVTFGTGSLARWNLADDETFNSTNLADASNMMTYNGGLSNLGAGLANATDVLQMAGNSPFCPDVCVAVAEGSPSFQAEYDAALPAYLAACDLEILININGTVPAGIAADLTTLPAMEHSVMSESDLPMGALIVENKIGIFYV